MFSPSDIERFGWADRGAMGISYNGITAADFDSQQELLWFVDKYSMVTSLTPGNQQQGALEQAVRWNVYSTFRTFRDSHPTALTTGGGNVYISSPHSIRGHRAGGMPCFNLQVPGLTGGQTQNKDGTTASKPPGAASSRGITQLHYMNSSSSSPKMIFSTDNPNIQIFDIETVGNDEANVISKSTGLAPITTMRVRHHPANSYVSNNNNNSSAADDSSYNHILTGSFSGEVILRDIGADVTKPVMSFPVSCNQIKTVDISGNYVLAASTEKRFSSIVKFFDIRKPETALQTMNLPNGVVTWGRFVSSLPSTAAADGSSTSTSSTTVPKCILMQPQEVLICEVNGRDYNGGSASPLSLGAAGSGTSTGVSPTQSNLATPVFPTESPTTATSSQQNQTSTSTTATAANGGADSSSSLLASMRILGTDGNTIVGSGNRQLASAAAIACNGSSIIFASDRGVMHTLTLEAPNPNAATGVTTAPSFAASNNNNNNNTGNQQENSATSSGQVSNTSFSSSPLTKGLLQCSASRKYPAQPQTISRWREFNQESGFNPKMDAETGKPAQQLLSNWPPEDYQILAIDPPATQLPPHLTEHAGLKILNRESFGVRRCDAYAANPKDRLGRLLPNPYPFGSELGDDKSLLLANLLELRRVNKNKQRANAPKSLYSKMEEALQLCYHTGGHVSSIQANFDWSHYNMSKSICGLDNSLPEAYIFVSILHALYHVQGDDPNGLRRNLMSHVCSKKLCVACEMGFLFSNMTTQAAHFMTSMPITQPTNFFRTLREHPVFKDFLREKATNRDEAIARVHKFVKLLLQALDTDLKEARQNQVSSSPGGPNFIMQDLTNFMASTFGTELALQSGTPLPPHFLWELPASASEVIEGLQHLLRVLERMHVGEPVVIQTLPHVLVLLLNPDHGTMKPPPNLNFSRQNENYSYHHCGSVVHLARDHDDVGHSVNHVKFGNQPPHENWYLINDYFVSKAMPREESLETMIPRQYSHAPIVAFYVRQPPNGKQRYGHQTVERPMIFDYCGRVLVDDFGIPQLGRKPPAITDDKMSTGGLPLPEKAEEVGEYETAAVVHLDTERDVQPGDLVAMDAEYVKLIWGNDVTANSDDMEPMDEWTKRMLQQQRKPSMSLARVSCILSRDPSDERVVIDDYIETQEAVEDYVTLYSGISEGDLDAALSRRRLTTAKAAHLKMRCLLDRGVKFVGHGLGQDFRVINLAIPPSQIIDTVEIFGKTGQRKISLRFLAYHALRERVQESMHDSIEDARTALRLYRRHQELVKEGRWEEELDRLFELGHDTNWRIPGESPPIPKNVLSALDSTTPTPTLETALAELNEGGISPPLGGDGEITPGKSGMKTNRSVRRVLVTTRRKINNASPAGSPASVATTKSNNNNNNDDDKNDDGNASEGNNITSNQHTDDDDDAAEYEEVEEWAEESYYEEEDEEEESDEESDFDSDEDEESDDEDEESDNDNDEKEDGQNKDDGDDKNKNKNKNAVQDEDESRSGMLPVGGSTTSAASASFPKTPVNREGTRGPEDMES